ncbi:MAG: ScpA family protein [Alphaproteobacteria bacterium]|nr:ScpA family protein [Alphaproteobacteria bacterium]
MAEDGFEAVAPDARRGEQLVLNLEGYEGPLDALLGLAREQKVDLTQISILQLADQYLEFVARARSLRLEVAADYLVMAAWLAYLKSRLLLPQAEDGEEPSGAEMAAALAFQLRRLEAMREAGNKLFARPQLGREVFVRGAPEAIDLVRRNVYEVSLYDILKAYGGQLRRPKSGPLTIEALDLYSVDEAIRRLGKLLGDMPDWQVLASFLPDELRSDIGRRSAIATTFAASLELVREGKATLRQDRVFGPIYMRGKRKPR